MSYTMKCSQCGVVGEIDRQVAEFECPQCHGIMYPLESGTEATASGRSIKVAKVVDAGFPNITPPPVGSPKPANSHSTLIRTATVSRMSRTTSAPGSLKFKKPKSASGGKRLIINRPGMAPHGLKKIVSAAPPVAPPVAEPVVQPVVEPVAPPVAEPVAPSVAEPVAPSVAEPVAPPVAEPVVQPVAEPVEQPVASSFSAVEETPVSDEASRLAAQVEELKNMKRAAEEALRKEREALEIQERERREAEEKARREAEEKVRLEAAEKQKRELEEQLRREREELEQQKAEAERLKREREEWERQRAEAERLKKEREELEQLRREREELERRRAEAERLKKEREELEKLRMEKARLEAEAKARREAEERAKREAEEKTRREAEEKARREFEEKIRKEREEIERQKAELQAGKTATPASPVPEKKETPPVEKSAAELELEKMRAEIEALRAGRKPEEKDPAPQETPSTEFPGKESDRKEKEKTGESPSGDGQTKPGLPPKKTDALFKGNVKRPFPPKKAFPSSAVAPRKKPSIPCAVPKPAGQPDASSSLPPGAQPLDEASYQAMLKWKKLKLNLIFIGGSMVVSLCLIALIIALKGGCNSTGSGRAAGRSRKVPVRVVGGQSNQKYTDPLKKNMDPVKKSEFEIAYDELNKIVSTPISRESTEKSLEDIDNKISALREFVDKWQEEGILEKNQTKFKKAQEFLKKQLELRDFYNYE